MNLVWIKLMKAYPTLHWFWIWGQVYPKIDGEIKEIVFFSEIQTVDLIQNHISRVFVGDISQHQGRPPIPFDKIKVNMVQWTLFAAHCSPISCSKQRPLVIKITIRVILLVVGESPWYWVWGIICLLGDNPDTRSHELVFSFWGIMLGRFTLTISFVVGSRRVNINVFLSILKK